MLGAKLVMATSAVIIHWLAPGTSWLTPTALMRFGLWSSENGAQPGAVLAGKDSLPEVMVSPLGMSPPDPFGVQSVAFCAEPFGCETEVLVVEGAAVDGLLPCLLCTTSTVATSAMIASVTRPATI